MRDLEVEVRWEVWIARKWSTHESRHEVYHGCLTLVLPRCPVCCGGSDLRVDGGESLMNDRGDSTSESSHTGGYSGSVRDLIMAAGTGTGADARRLKKTVLRVESL
jgi:hypothetical protein